jgi:hypothetical protein
MFRSTRKAVGSGIATALALGAVASPAAVAQPMDSHAPDTGGVAAPDQRSPDTRDFAKGGQIVASTPIRVAAPQRPTGSGFDVGDAAIGAGGALTLVVATLGGAAVLVRRRHRLGATSRPARTAG